MKVLKPIGGEQWFDLNLFRSDANNFLNADFTFLSGGQSSLNFILKQLDLKEGEVILLPAYLCPTIVWNLQRNKAKYRFYRIKQDLTIDLEDLEAKISEHNPRAVLFINYFGVYHGGETLEYMSSLKNKGIALIEDAVQMLWFSRQYFIGDYVFNSFRKFLPIDGSLVISEAKGEFGEVIDEYYEHMNMARLKITAYVKYGLGTAEDFVKLYLMAEEDYGKTTEVKGMAEISRDLLNKVDVKGIGEARRRNFAYLEARLAECGCIKPLFKKEDLGGNIPIGYPVLIENRDSIKSALRSRAIYCPAHWPILGEPWVGAFPESMELAKKILTLPIDQRYDEDDMDRLIGEILRLC